jgi:hypothetical protein
VALLESLDSGWHLLSGHVWFFLYVFLPLCCYISGLSGIGLAMGLALMLETAGVYLAIGHWEHLLVGV